MDSKKIPLVVAKFVSKSGREVVCLKFGNKIVTFDEVIICAMANKSPRDLMLMCVDEEIILAEF